MNSDTNAMGWFFLLLTVIFISIAVNPRWRNKWGWGRGGQAGPLSLVGWGAWIFAFSSISAAAFGFLPPYFIFAAFVIVMVAGFYDAWFNRNSDK